MREKQKQNDDWNSTNFGITPDYPIYAPTVLGLWLGLGLGIRAIGLGLGLGIRLRIKDQG